MSDVLGSRPSFLLVRITQIRWLQSMIRESGSCSEARAALERYNSMSYSDSAAWADIVLAGQEVSRLLSGEEVQPFYPSKEIRSTVERICG